MQLLVPQRAEESCEGGAENFLAAAAASELVDLALQYWGNRERQREPELAEQACQKS